MSRYRWQTPAECISELCDGWDETQLRREFKRVLALLDSDQTQDEYQSAMDEAGYFKPEEEAR